MNIYLTEQQMTRLLETAVLKEQGGFDMLFESTGNYQSFKMRILSMVRKGLVTAAFAIASIGTMINLSDTQKDELKVEVAEQIPQEEWGLVSTEGIVTVYNARPEQCNSDFGVTASGFRLNLDDVASHHICAMERTFMSKLGVKYGDVVKIEGTYLGKQDGVYVIHDTMNKKYAGMPKIDILTPDNIRYGGTLDDAPAKIYVLNDKAKTEKYTSTFAPQVSKSENIAQMQKKREQMAKEKEKNI